MPSFEYIAAYPLFYPDKRDADGQSLMAQRGVIADWDASPGAEWVETDEAPNWGGPAPAAEAPEVPQPEPPQEAPALEPEPEPAPAEPIVPEPVPVPPFATGGTITAPVVTENPRPQFPFPGFAPPVEPYSR